MNDSIDDFPSKEKEKIENPRARQLWRRLADVLRNCSVANSTFPNRRPFKKEHRFENIDFIRWEPLNDENGKSELWWRAILAKPTTKSIIDPPSLIFSFVDPSINAGDLIGFDNTGNVRVWISEEILAFWCVWSIDLFEESRDFTICELAGGMSCLCGLFLASALEKNHNNRFILTDGNEKCVHNVRSILERNAESFGNLRIEARLLKFGCIDEQAIDFCGEIDIILAADCLFYIDAHEDFLITVEKLLKQGGRGFVVAPDRNGTRNRFISLARSIGKFDLLVSDFRDMDVFRNFFTASGDDGTSPFGNGNVDIDFPKLLTLIKL